MPLLYRCEMCGSNGEWSMIQTIYTHSFERVKKLKAYAKKHKLYFFYEVLEL